MPIYNPPLLTVDMEEVKRYAGLHGQDFSAKLVAEAIGTARLLAKPRTSYEIYDYDAERNHLVACSDVIGGNDALAAADNIFDFLPFSLEGSSIRRHLADCEKVVILAATVGADIEDMVTKNFSFGRYAYSLLLDAAATAAVEHTADALEKEIDGRLKKYGLHRRRRFSPGYGDWPLKAQSAMLALSGGENIGLSLTSAFMLEPRKSITAAIGLSRVPLDEKSAGNQGEKSCAACQKSACPLRKNVRTENDNVVQDNQ